MRKKNDCLMWAMRMAVTITGKRWNKLNRKEKEDLLELANNCEDKIMFEKDKSKIWAWKNLPKLLVENGMI